MKNLNDLGLNPKNILKNDELLSLKGGINCICTSGDEIVMTGSAQNVEECNEMCSVYGDNAVFMPAG